jgi:hypothetical protein
MLYAGGKPLPFKYLFRAIAFLNCTKQNKKLYERLHSSFQNLNQKNIISLLF